MTTWRPARSDEDDALVEMSLALYGDAAALLGVEATQIYETLETFRREPLRGRALVLDADGELAGFSFLAAFWSNELGGEICVVDELYVKPDWRGRGHATALLAALRTDRLLWPRRPVAFELEVAPQNPDARRLYERLGYREKPNTTLRLRLRG